MNVLRKTILAGAFLAAVGAPALAGAVSLAGHSLQAYYSYFTYSPTLTPHYDDRGVFTASPAGYTHNLSGPVDFTVTDTRIILTANADFTGQDYQLTLVDLTGPYNIVTGATVDPFSTAPASPAYFAYGPNSFSLDTLYDPWTAGQRAIYNIQFAAVPEPGAWALMLLGFAGLGAAMRANRKRGTVEAG